MKSKGFTLVEILAVIVIIGVLAMIAIPNAAGILSKQNKRMYCTKVEDILTAAKLYGENHYNEIDRATNKSVSISVRDLIKENLYKKEDDNCTLNSDSIPCVLDPRDKSSMDAKTITVTIKNRRAMATYDDADYKTTCENI